MNEAQANIEDRRNNPGKIFGLSTGLMDLDRLTDGMHKSEMITVCALPSCGKTALAVGAVVHNAIRGIPGMILTAEMRPVQIITRSICSEARVNFRKILDEDFEKMTKSVKVLNKAPLHIIQVSGMSINQVRAIARRLKQRHDVQCGMIDYIQLLSGDGDNKEGQVSSISKGIKALCMELEIPILALSQLTEKATGGFTTKYATAIGEDTDSLWRIRNDGDWKPEVQPVKLMVEKSRDGATGPVDLTFRKTITRFENAAQDEEQPNLKPAERTKRDDPYPD